jgi:scaffold protein (connect acetoacetyl-CoA thiolase and HMG-CoA synthase)
MIKKEIAIVAYKCKKCGKLHYPFHDRCLNCKNREFETVKPQGKAKLLTWTRIFNLPWGFDQRYLTIGVVEFENGIKAMGQINVDESFDLRDGMTLQPEWGPIRVQYGEKVYGLVLEPVAAG